MMFEFIWDVFGKGNIAKQNETHIYSVWYVYTVGFSLVIYAFCTGLRAQTCAIDLIIGRKTQQSLTTKLLKPLMWHSLGYQWISDIALYAILITTILFLVIY